MLNHLNALLMTLLLWSGVVLITLLAIDALEYESTGACQDCIILPHLANRYGDNDGH